MLQIKQINDIHVASFSNLNRFNSVISQSVKDELSRIVSEKSARLVLDLAGIKFIDSSAFGALISILNTANENQSTFKICNPSPEVHELIMVMQLDTVFEISQNIDECVKSFA